MRRAAIAGSALAAGFAAVPAVAWAQNAPPKPDAECGVTSMCLRDPTVSSHGHAPSWAVALIMLAVVIAVLTVIYRVVVARSASG